MYAVDIKPIKLGKILVGERIRIVVGAHNKYCVIEYAGLIEPLNEILKHILHFKLASNICLYIIAIFKMLYLRSVAFCHRITDKRIVCVAADGYIINMERSFVNIIINCLLRQFTVRTRPIICQVVKPVADSNIIVAHTWMR